MVAVLRDGLVVGDVLSQLVVQFRKLGLLDALDGDFEGGLLAGQRLNVVLGEGDDDIALVAGLHANDLLLEAGHERVGAELKVIILGRAAVKLLAIDEAGEVDRDMVAHLRLALNIEQAGVALLDIVHLFVDLALVKRFVVLRDLEALVLAELHFRVHTDLEGIDQLFVLGDLLVDQARRADALKAAVGTACLERILRQRLDGVGVEHFLAVHTLDDGARGLALAEAGHVEMVLILFICFVDRIVKDIGRDLHFKGRHVFFFLFDVLDVHWVSSSNHLSPGALFT